MSGILEQLCHKLGTMVFALEELLVLTFDQWIIYWKFVDSV